MKMIAVILVILLTTHPALAWNSTGHKAIALIAYEQLTPAAKKQLDTLLSKHPDYSKWVEAVAPQERGRAAFVAASSCSNTSS